MAHAQRTSYWQLKTIHDAITGARDLYSFQCSGFLSCHGRGECAIGTELIARSDDAGANWIVMPFAGGSARRDPARGAERSVDALHRVTERH